MSVIEQLTEYCDCLKTDSPRFERDVDELINLISVYTCWAQNPCDTFLMSERKQVVSVPPCLDDCDVFIFEPFYTPFDVDSFTFTLIEQNGTTETDTPITDFTYSAVDENFRLALGLPECECKPKCGCESTYKLLVTYNAGYEEIPECLLPIFCDALQYIIEKNACDCTCEVCDEADYTSTTSINYTTLEGNLKAYFLSVLTYQYRRALSLIALCENHNLLWGLVV